MSQNWASEVFPKQKSQLINTGDVVAVKGGRMRNTLYPYSMAQYLRPGMGSFLTANKLAIPVGPNYRKLLKKIEPDPIRMEFKELFEKASLFCTGVDDRRNND